MSATTKAPKLAIQYPTETYLIEGLCGQVLDVLHKRGDAIRTYIMDYKARNVDGAKLIYIRGGMRYTVNPSGTAADYN